MFSAKHHHSHRSTPHHRQANAFNLLATDPLLLKTRRLCPASNMQILLHHPFRSCSPPTTPHPLIPHYCIRQTLMNLPEKKCFVNAAFTNPHICIFLSPPCLERSLCSRRTPLFCASCTSIPPSRPSCRPLHTIPTHTFQVSNMPQCSHINTL